MKMNLMKRLITITVALTIIQAICAGGAYALRDNNNGTMTDYSTGLVWLKNANCFSLQNWQTAMNSVAGLSSGACGLTDNSKAGQWRLPTKEELQARAVNMTGFTDMQATYYWSSTTHWEGYAWVVWLKYNKLDYSKKELWGYVLPVRSR